MQSAARVDIFCRVIDNLGDIGVSWRLASQLYAEKGCRVRLWVDQIEALERIAPTAYTTQPSQSADHISIHHWGDEASFDTQTIEPADIVISAFSCDLPKPYLERMAQRRASTWFALEYLSAESWTSQFHLQTSKRDDGLEPIFFFPGFVTDSGGLLREHDLMANLDTWRAQKNKTEVWLTSLGVEKQWLNHARLVSVFSYPGAPLQDWVSLLRRLARPTLLLIPEGMQTDLAPDDSDNDSHVRWKTIPFLPQAQYDRLLWSMDLNIVRGEDSFVRAIWAGKPFVWHIYPQDDDHHHRKLQAWLDVAKMPTDVQQMLHEWSRGQADEKWPNLLEGPNWQQWQTACVAHRTHLLGQDSLADRLIAVWRATNHHLPP